MGLLIFSARLNASREDWNAAIEDLHAAWVFVRHLAHDGTLASWNIHFRYVDMAISPLAASWVPELDKVSLRELEQLLPNLPSSPEFSHLLRTDRSRLLDWLEKRAVGKNVAAVKDDLIRLTSDDDLTASMRQAESTDEVLKWIDETRRMIDEAILIVELSIDEFEPAATEFRDHLSVSNPLALALMGEFGNTESILDLKYQEVTLQARLAMFQAAIALELDGREGFARILDPFSGELFEYQEFESGYTMTSKLVVDGERFTMKFGDGAVPEPGQRPYLAVYDPQSDARAEIKQALKTARDEGKRVLLQWGFNGCIPCYRLHRMFDENESIVEILQDGFVRLSVDVTNAKNESLRNDYNVQLPGVPHLTILDANGSVLVNAKPSQEFQVHGNLNDQLIRRFLQKYLPNGTRSNARDR